MADVFESHPQLVSARIRLFQLIESTEALDWLILTKRPENIRDMVPPAWLEQPRPNVWFGTSVEDSRRAAERIAVLAEVPAAVRFLSCEPLLGPVGALDLSSIHWVIVGGESGPGARRMDPAWALAIRDQCRKSQRSFFFKQAGSALAVQWGMEGKGHDFKQIPVELRVREFPRANVCGECPVRTGDMDAPGPLRETQAVVAL
jgi:protein gp37